MPRQHGGGMYSEYCPLCGLPFNIATDYDFKKAGVNVNWMYSAVGFDFEKKLQFNLEGYDDYGRMSFSEKQFPKTKKALEEVPSPDGFTINYESGPFNDREEHPYEGVAFHRACFQVVVKASKDGRMTLKDVERLSRYASYGCDGSKYHEQFYNWEDALEEEGPKYFRSPLRDPDFAGDIIACLGEGYFPDNVKHNNNNKNNKKNNKNNNKKNNNTKKNNNKKNNNGTRKNNNNNNNSKIAPNFKKLTLRTVA